MVIAASAIVGLRRRARIAGWDARRHLDRHRSSSIAAIVAYAWIDGGREPQRMIEQPVPLPRGRAVKRRYWLAGAVLAVSSTLALAAAEIAAAAGVRQSHADAVAHAGAAPRRPSAAAPSRGTGAAAQPLPGVAGGTTDAAAAPPAEQSPAGRRAREDGPRPARRAVRAQAEVRHSARRPARAGKGRRHRCSAKAVSRADALAGQPASLIRAALAGTTGPLVSRWGHILLRRTLASRLDAPPRDGPGRFAALRAALLDRMGEGAGARAGAGCRFGQLQPCSSPRPHSTPTSRPATSSASARSSS